MYNITCTPFILNNFIVLSLEHDANIPELNWVIEHITLLCSLMIKSSWYLFLLYIIIDLSYKPGTSLKSFIIHKQYT